MPRVPPVITNILLVNENKSLSIAFIYDRFHFCEDRSGTKNTTQQSEPAILQTLVWLCSHSAQFASCLSLDRIV